MSFELSGTTGKTTERELFGHTERSSSSPEYMNREDEFRLVRTLQPEGSDPHDPKHDFAASVMIEIEKMLDVSGKDAIRFYTAVGSPLDRHQGIDGWYEYDGNKVTIDLTVNDSKGAEKKADIVFLVPHGGLDRTVNAKQFSGYTQVLAQMIVDRFLHATTRTAYAR